MKISMEKQFIWWFLKAYFVDIKDLFLIIEITAFVYCFVLIQFGVVAARNTIKIKISSIFFTNNVLTIISY
jgi:hypothetical protein